MRIELIEIPLKSYSGIGAIKANRDFIDSDATYHAQALYVAFRILHDDGTEVDVSADFANESVDESPIFLDVGGGLRIESFSGSLAVYRNGEGVRGYRVAFLFPGGGSSSYEHIYDVIVNEPRSKLCVVLQSKSTKLELLLDKIDLNQVWPL